MPRKSEWFSRVPEALELLAAFPAPFLDRLALEKLLGLHRRVAIRLMHRFGGYQAGRTFLIEREKLISGLTEILNSGDFGQERGRWVRFAKELEEARSMHKGRQVPIPAPPTHFQSRIRLEQGHLEIRFETALELLQSLVELAKSISDDFDGIQRRIEGV
jgi:hypothetical protein